jgi:hypothetical protein
MQHAYGTRQGNLVAAQNQHFALHAAQAGKRVARGETAAVDYPIRDFSSPAASR